jgi:hypothetical protein
MSVFQQGAVYRYQYLWAREHDLGEDAGRKPRPCCLVVITPSAPENLFFFPLTSSRPRDDTLAMALPAAECHRVGLREPCWIILGEYNVAHASRLYDLIDTEPMGRFSDRFLTDVALQIKAATEKMSIRAVPRV